MKKYAFIIGALLSLSSCEDFLELNPKTQISEDEYYKNEGEIYKGLVSVYDILQAGHDHPHYYVTLCADIMSDDINPGGDATDQPMLQVLDDFTVSPITNPSGLWWQYYKGVYRANAIIAKIPAATGEPANLQRMNVEAHLLRSIFYYWLWLYYGNLVVLTENIANPSEYYTQKQLTAEEVYNFLIKDLDENVIGKLPMTVPTSENGRLTDAVARTLKAKIVLYQNDESRFKEIASELEPIIGNASYDLVEDFESIWLRNGEHNKESIFEVEFSVDDYNKMPQMIFPRGLKDPTNTFLEGWGFGSMPKATVDIYEDGDIRKHATVFAIADSVELSKGTAYEWAYTPVYQNTGYFLKKYAPRVGYYGSYRFGFENNLRIFRYSDVLLMASEAALRSQGGDQGKAQTNFAKVWKRARPKHVGDAPAVTLDLLYEERHKEFVGEGHRYWDLVRTGQAADVLKDKGWKTHNRYLPIPDAEITKSQGVLKQNEGYN